MYGTGTLCVAHALGFHAYQHDAPLYDLLGTAFIRHSTAADEQAAAVCGNQLCGILRREEFFLANHHVRISYVDIQREIRDGGGMVDEMERRIQMGAVVGAHMKGGHVDHGAVGDRCQLLGRGSRITGEDHGGKELLGDIVQAVCQKPLVGDPLRPVIGTAEQMDRTAGDESVFLQHFPHGNITGMGVHTDGGKAASAGFGDHAADHGGGGTASAEGGGDHHAVHGGIVLTVGEPCAVDVLVIRLAAGDECIGEDHTAVLLRHAAYACGDIGGGGFGRGDASLPLIDAQRAHGGFGFFVQSADGGGILRSCGAEFHT